jgi:peptide-methionine (S)-S-oxide reductase
MSLHFNLMTGYAMWRSLLNTKPQMVDPKDALVGRTTAIEPSEVHAVFNTPMLYESHVSPTTEQLVIGMGCFWGAERLFWRHSGVVSTAVGYAGGYTPHPTYQEICSGLTGHTEVVQVYFDTKKTTLNELLKLFWENHDPTQGMRQGNDVGTQYRSVLYWTQPHQEILNTEVALLD